MSTIDTNKSYAIQGQTLQDICNAVKSKTGDQSVNVSDLPSKIASIQTGGGDTTISYPKDITFIDYDGTILEEYDLSEYLQKPASTSQGYSTYYVPNPPTHSGLTFEGWNLTNDTDIGTYVTKLGFAIIGANYKTTDDKVHLYLEIEDQDELSLLLSYYHSAAGYTSEIDWGDGTTTSVADGKETKQNSHTYSTLGSYVIKISVGTTSSDTISLGSNTNNYTLISKYPTNNPSYGYGQEIKCLRKVELSNRAIGFYGCCFTNNSKLESISMSRYTVTAAGGWPKANANYLFMGCSSLKCLVIPPPPNSTTYFYFGSYNFSGCTSLRYMSFPVVNDLAGYTNPLTASNFVAFSLYSTKRSMYAPPPQSIPSLLRYSYGTGATTLQTSVVSPGANHNGSLRSLDLSNWKLQTMFNVMYCGSLEEFKPPTGITGFASNGFSYCFAIPEFDFSKSAITSVPGSCFAYCYNCLKYDFTGCASVPSLSNTNAFTGISANAKIYVPSSLATSWKAATNWSTYASYIVGVESVNIKNMSEVVVDTVKIETGGSWGTWLGSSFNKSGYHEEYSSVLGTNVIVNSAGTLVLGVDTDGMGPMAASPVFLSDTVNTSYTYYLVDTIPIN